MFVKVNLKIATIEFETRESIIFALQYYIHPCKKKSTRRIEFKILYIINIYMYIRGRKNSE